VIVLGDGGGWNGEAAVGSPAVVAVGVVGAVGGVGAGAGARVGAGGGRVAVRAGGAGGTRRAGRGFGASTVTCATVMVGASPLGGVSGCVPSGAGASAGGICGVGGGVSITGGVSGACDDATPAQQSSMSAELLSRSKRLLRMDMTRRSSPTSIHHGEKQRRMQDRRSLACAKPGRLAVRCQAMGGARAWKRARCDAIKSNATAPSSRSPSKMLGSGKGGVSAGTIAPARWINVQIGQRWSARSS